MGAPMDDEGRITEWLLEGNFEVIEGRMNGGDKRVPVICLPENRYLVMADEDYISVVLEDDNTINILTYE